MATRNRSSSTARRGQAPAASGAEGETGSSIDVVLKALSEPNRRAIVELVAVDELSAGEIAGSFDVNRTTVSQHLTVLKSAGLIVERRAGTKRLYRARPEGLEALRQMVEGMWVSSLDVARRIVEAEAGLVEEDVCRVG